MSCTDCKGSTPSRLWKRCVACAISRLRILMSDTPKESPLKEDTDANRKR